MSYPKGFDNKEQEEAVVSKLVQALNALDRLLDCPDLNLDELEDETIEAIEQARTALMGAEEYITIKKGR